MDLVKLITDKIQQIEQTGKLDKIVEKYAVECLEDIVKDSFKWDGEAKKAIKKELNSKLGVNLENIKIPQYQKLVSTIVENQLNKTIVPDLQHQIEKSIDNITGVLEKKDWKLSEIIEKFIETIDKSYDGGMDEHQETCSLFVSSDGKFQHVYFNAENVEKEHQCSNRLFIYDGKLSSVMVDEKTFSPLTANSMHGFEAFMFQLYCNGVTIEIDENWCELEYYREDYD